MTKPRMAAFAPDNAVAASPAQRPAPHLTHEVENQPPPLEDWNPYLADRALGEGVRREGGGFGEERLAAFGAATGTAVTLKLADQANKYGPELRLFDRFGHRIDEVEFHPAWHELMALAMRHGVHSFAWTERRPGAHVVRAALSYLQYQAESGVSCPMAMTFAGLPVLYRQPEIAAEWAPRLTSPAYDPRPIPAAEKTGATMGMAMTEKQGGSDLRANSTKARPLGRRGPGAEYALTGHKWFCSAPMSDAFLTLAYAEGGLSCFFVPRSLPDGSRNRFLIQRLKSKLGNRSNASSEIEYDETWSRLVGEEGRGVATIIEMVHHTRLECVIGSAGLMRIALAQAVHHTSHRSAFQRRLIDQPLMRNVLADMAIEQEAATVLMLRLARAFDEAAAGSESAKAFGRIATAIGKYWICKRSTPLVAEALECHGGNGYVEDSIMPRLYREAPLNGIWEGSGNVICLDVLRAMRREPAAPEALAAELDTARGGDRRYERFVDRLMEALGKGDEEEGAARRLVERMALALQAALLIRHAPAAVADAFCAARLEGEGGMGFGTLPAGVDLDSIIERARPLPA